MFTVGMADDMVTDMLRAPSSSRATRDEKRNNTRRVAESRSPHAAFKTKMKSSPDVDGTHTDGCEDDVPLGDMVGGLTLQVIICITHAPI